MIDLFSAFTRQLYIIPGGYFVVKLISSLFKKPKVSTTKIIETPYKFKIKLDISKYLGNKIYWRGAHDWNTIFAAKKIICPTYNILDIGANTGEYTMFFASIINERSKVWAFEPVKTVFDTFKENIQLNSHLYHKIIPIQKAIGKQRDRIPIFDENENENEGLYSIYPANFHHSKKVQDIEIDTLDNFVNQNNIQSLNFIKIDVEGNELFVLQGAHNTIKEMRPILMIEISEKNFRAAGYSSQDILQHLNQIHYDVYLIKTRGRLKKIHSADNLPVFCNIIAFPSKLQ